MQLTLMCLLCVTLHSKWFAYINFSQGTTTLGDSSLFMSFFTWRKLKQNA